METGAETVVLTTVEPELQVEPETQYETQPEPEPAAEGMETMLGKPEPRTGMVPMF